MKYTVGYDIDKHGEVEIEADTPEQAEEYARDKLADICDTIDDSDASFYVEED